MKTIGTTKEGNHLVEMSEDELKEFSRLRDAVEGESQADFYSRGNPALKDDIDFTNVFHVIRAFYLTQFRINELQTLIDEMRKKLNGKSISTGAAGVKHLI